MIQNESKNKPVKWIDKTNITYLQIGSFRYLVKQFTTYVNVNIEQSFNNLTESNDVVNPILTLT